MKSLIVTLMLIMGGCSYFQDEKADEHFFVRETLTSHCFEVWRTKKDWNYMWIDCHKLPRRGDVRDVQEFDTYGMTQWEGD